MEGLSAPLRKLLAAEIAAGNAITQEGAGFPAPPVGGCIQLERAVSTALPPGVLRRVWPNWRPSTGYTDADERYFVMDPPEPEPPPPDMDAIRGALAGGAAPPVPLRSPPGPPPADTPLGRFQASMIIGYEQWHDGIGYDLEAVAAASPSERREIEQALLARGPVDWRDVEALAALDTPAAHRSLCKALESSNAEVRMAVQRHAPSLVSREQRLHSLLWALREADFYEGLTQALDEAVDFHPPEVIAALWDGCLSREGPVAYHFAATLAALSGKADSRFEWEHRPLFLRFNTPDVACRRAALAELRTLLSATGDEMSGPA